MTFILVAVFIGVVGIVLANEVRKSLREVGRYFDSRWPDQ